MFKKVVLIIIVLISLFSVIAIWLVGDKVNHAYTLSAQLDITKGLEVSEATVILDRSGEELGRAFIENRSSISRGEVSQNLVDAILAVEDAEFFKHDGVFLKSLVRAAVQNLKIGGVAQGGSTITQQLAKHVINNHSRTVERKLLELFVALRLERELPKDDILMFYLNRVFFGSGFYGIEAAAKGYFGVPASQLSMAQASFLAGLVKAPSALNPYKYKSRAKNRQKIVLDRLVAVNRLTSSEAATIYTEPITILPRFRQTIGVKSYPTSKALRLVESKLSENSDIGEVIIHTSIDSKLQTKLEEIVKDLPEQSAIGVINKKTGEILGYVGGNNYLDSQYDRLFQMRRDSGQIMAVEQAALLFNKGYSAASLIATHEHSRAKILLQDAISLLDRPSLSTLFQSEILSPEDVLQRYLLLVGTYAPITLVTGFQINKDLPVLNLKYDMPPFPSFSRESADEALSMLLESGTEGYNFLQDGIYVSSSIGGFDAWGVALKADIIVVAWLGFDKPETLGGKEQIEQKIANILQLEFEAPVFQPITSGYYVSRSTGLALPYSEKFAGSVFIHTAREVPVIPTVGPQYIQLPFFKDLAASTLSQIKNNDEQFSKTRMLIPAPRPAFISSDDVVLVDSPLTSGNFFFMPRLESFQNASKLSSFLTSLPFPNPNLVLASRRGLPTMLKGENKYTVKWPIYTRRYNFSELYNILSGVAGVEQATNEGNPLQDEPLFPLLAGRDGLELMCDKLALTVSGYVTYSADALGYPQSAVFEPPTASPAVYLTINHKMQVAATEAMHAVQRGSFVVMDAKTGDVMVSVSKPLSDKLNRVTNGIYPPGSAFKPFTALSKYISDPDFNNSVEFDLGDIILPGASFIFPREVGRASLDTAMANSYNSFFMKLGMSQEPTDFVGNLALFGFGVRTGFFLGDLAGLVPSPQYVLDRHRREMASGDLANLAIGQGDLLVTPLQMVRAYGAIATRGIIVSPRLLKTETIIAKPFLHGEEWKAWYDIDKALQGVVTSGTGRSAFLADFPSLRGKTGTAQVGPKKLQQLTAWFCGYFKFNDRICSFAIAVEGDPFEHIAGGSTAAPVIRKFLNALDVDKLGSQDYGLPETAQAMEGMSAPPAQEYSLETLTPNQDGTIDFSDAVDNILKRSLLPIEH